MAFPTYREHGVLYCRGIDPIMPLGLFRGVDQGGWDPNEFKFNMYTIVIGAQTLHATGYAMGITMDGKVGTDDGEAVIAYFGDGATSQGDVNEAFVWASVFNSPIVFFCQNNQYAISEPLERQTRIPLYQRAAGFGFPGVRVDGNDVLATYAVTRAALDNARHGQGPTLIEAYTYRMGAHTTSDDPTRYRIASEVEAWQAKDPIARMKAFLDKQQHRRRRASSPRSTTTAKREAVAPARAGARRCPTRSRSACSTTSTRTARPSSTSSARSSPLPGVVRGERPLMTETITLGKALNTGLRRAMEDDPKVVLMGEDIGKLGGVFRITDGLQKDFGDERVIDTPLAESGIIGTAIGLAIRGYRPVCEIQFDGFVYPAYDQIVVQVAKMHYRSQGKVRLPIVIRIPFGGGIGAVEHHSESPEAYFAHTAGLKVVACANPDDAYWMIQQAIASDDPIVFFEPKRRYWEKGEVDLDAPLADAYPLHASRVVRPGHRRHRRWRTGRWCAPRSTRPRRPPRTAATLEVIDLRYAVPAGHGPGLRLGAPDRPLRGRPRGPGNLGLGAEIAARVTEECFYSLEAPVLRVTGFDTPYPASRVEEEYLPDLDRVLDAVDRSFGW